MVVNDVLTLRLAVKHCCFRLSSMFKLFSRLCMSFRIHIIILLATFVRLTPTGVVSAILCGHSCAWWSGRFSKIWSIRWAIGWGIPSSVSNRLCSFSLWLVLLIWLSEFRAHPMAQPLKVDDFVSVYVPLVSMSCFWCHSISATNLFLSCWLLRYVSIWFLVVSIVCRRRRRRRLSR